MKTTAIQDELKINITNLNGYSTGLLQGKAYRVLHTHLTHTLFRFELTVPEWKLIGQLYDHGNMRLADLSDRLDVEAPLVTALVDQLEKKVLVKRESDPTDKRAKIIKITKKGSDVIPEIEKSVKITMNSLLHGVSREDLLTYIRVLECIVNNG